MFPKLFLGGGGEASDARRAAADRSLQTPLPSGNCQTSSQSLAPHRTFLSTPLPPDLAVSIFYPIELQPGDGTVQELQAETPGHICARTGGVVTSCPEGDHHHGNSGYLGEGAGRDPLQEVGDWGRLGGCHWSRLEVRCCRKSGSISLSRHLNQPS